MNPGAVEPSFLGCSTAVETEQECQQRCLNEQRSTRHGGVLADYNLKKPQVRSKGTPDPQSKHVPGQTTLLSMRTKGPRGRNGK